MLGLCHFIFGEISNVKVIIVTITVVPRTFWEMAEFIWCHSCFYRCCWCTTAILVLTIHQWHNISYHMTVEFVLVLFKTSFVCILLATYETINSGTIIFLMNPCNMPFEVSFVWELFLARWTWDKVRSITMCTLCVVFQRCSVCESFWALVTFEFPYFKVHPICVLVQIRLCPKHFVTKVGKLHLSRLHMLVCADLVLLFEKKICHT